MQRVAEVPSLAPEPVHESHWLYDSISTSGSGNYSWNEVDFVTDVLVNKDLNLDPLLIIESDYSKNKPEIKLV